MRIRDKTKDYTYYLLIIQNQTEFYSKIYQMENMYQFKIILNE